MKIEFDPAKSAKNDRERGLPFDLVADFDWEGAAYVEDTRFSYPERRFVAVGYLEPGSISSVSRRSRTASESSVFAERAIERCVDMSRKPLTDKKGEVRELEVEDFRGMRPAAEVLPPELVAVLPKRKPGQRGPQKSPTKQQVTLRLDQDVLTHFRSKGAGWQSRINKSLRKAANL